MAPEPAGWRRARCRRGPVVLLFCMMLPGALAAQQTVATDTVPAGTLVVDTTASRISPRGAMLRSFLIPGWGQGSVGSYRRGAILFSLRVGAGYMLFKTIGRLNEARQIAARGERMARDSLDTLAAVDERAWHILADDRGLSNPETYATAVDSFPGLANARALVRAREQQRQDWITTFIVVTLLDGIDAYVNAQFDDFPVSIDTRPAPGGGASLRVTVPLRWGGAPNAGDPRRGAQVLRPRSRRR